MRTSLQQETQDSHVARAFNHAAAGYDTSWTRSLLGRLQRLQVRRVVRTLFHPGDRILELGCGTGADAAWLAAAGIRVHATDISSRMLDIARARVERRGLAQSVTFERLDIERMAELRDQGPFDGALSNFGAINCVSDLHSAASELARMVRPGGKVALCFMGRFCLWETLWYLLRLKPAKAFRRPAAGVRGTDSVFGPGCAFRVFYPRAGALVQAFAQFDLVSDRGVAVLVPPSYVERHALAWRHWAAGLARLDQHIGAWPILRACGDHRVLVFERSRCR